MRKYHVSIKLNDNTIISKFIWAHFTYEAIRTTKMLYEVDRIGIENIWVKVIRRRTKHCNYKTNYWMGNYCPNPIRIEVPEISNEIEFSDFDFSDENVFSDDEFN